MPPPTTTRGTFRKPGPFSLAVAGSFLGDVLILTRPPSNELSSEGGAHVRIIVECAISHDGIRISSPPLSSTEQKGSRLSVEPRPQLSVDTRSVCRGQASFPEEGRGLFDRAAAARLISPPQVPPQGSSSKKR